VNLSLQKSKNMLSTIKIHAEKGKNLKLAPWTKLKKNPFSFRQLNPLSKNLKIFQTAQKMREEM